MPQASHQDEIVRKGLEIFRLMETAPPALFKKDWWVGRVLQMTMADPQLKLNLFRFIDVLPTLTTQDLLVAHLEEYFHAEAVPASLLSTLFAGKGGLAAGLAARLLKRNIAAVARTFIAGETPADALPALKAIRDAGRTFTMDILGEAALSEEEARGYGESYLSLVDFLARELAVWPPLHPERERLFPRLNVSVKLSSLYSRLGPMNYEDSVREGRERLRPICRRVREAGGFVNLDMEAYSLKNITVDVFTSLLSEPEFRSWSHAGIALQAYLRETEEDIGRLAVWAGERGTPVTVRLVKGAYWEYEAVVARQKGWPLPVFATKGESDRSFELCAELLLAHNDLLLPAFGSHNVRSLAAAMVAAERHGIRPERLELQMLFGMAEPVKKAVGRLGYQVREYVPVGPLLPGMAYLVRRLLENTSNEGFLRRTFADRVEWGRLLAEPVLPSATPPVSAPAGGIAPFANEPPLDLSRREVRDTCHAAIDEVRGRLGVFCPALIGGREWSGGQCVVSVNPARPAEIVGRVAAVGKTEVEEAIAAALQAQRQWAGRSAEDRAAVLFRAAAIARERRYELLAWQVFETGKNWVEADADVAEAIDYLEYYGREMLRLHIPTRLGDAPGEVNRYLYRPLGVGVVIAPWNFPLAISAGMVAAPLVAGNAVLYKPSSLSPVNGWLLVSLFREAGVPPGVLSFLPGAGGEIGTLLAGHPEVDFIAFTGSREVGLAIASTAAGHPGRRGVRRVVAEMGGKNAIIVDADADLDQAVAGVLQSAFGYQGQKCSACSRVIVLEQCYERFLARLTEAVRGIAMGPPEDPTFFMGPLIDRGAVERVRSYLESGRQEGRVVVIGEAPAEGFFHGAAVVTDLPPDSLLLREEIFGPILAVVRAADMAAALTAANAVDYALTGGVYSRSPGNIARVSAEFTVGNLYINRPITGALVGRQPFGGFRYSGVGSKAGGPDYVRQFLQPQVVTENTMRRGFTPETL
jgi:RHH-type transcriptional regulator, proline utilization regulon repressor / proline dehydrogenase / delta 1-pyrroline-5-carboxylate dehydrogenase